LWSEFEGSFRDAERRVVLSAFLSKNCAITCTSAGRLFDAWAALLGLAERSSYEAEAAIRLEEIADEGEPGALPVAVIEDSADGFLRIDWRPWVAETLRLRRQGVAPSVLSARFHNALAQSCLEIARRVGIGTVALSGGCFHNKFLAGRVERLLAQDGFRVLTHQRVPPGDGGLAVGQLWACALGGFEPETKAREG
jgi:hydrogenase maturation protein HypF